MEYISGNCKKIMEVIFVVTSERTLKQGLQVDRIGLPRGTLSDDKW